MLKGRGTGPNKGDRGLDGERRLGRESWEINRRAKVKKGRKKEGEKDDKHATHLLI
jgi:hypothetical protein